MTDNPLINLKTQLNYRAIKPIQIKQAIDYWLNKNRIEVKRIHSLKKNEITWKNSTEQLLNQANNLDKAFSIASHFNMVCDSSEIRKVFKHCMIEIEQFSNELKQDKKIYQNLLLLQKNKTNLYPAQIRYLALEIKKFEKEGVHLKSAKRKELKKINQDLAKISLSFEQNIQDSLNQFSLLIQDKNELAGLSENLIESFRKNQIAATNTQAGYLILLNQPSYSLIMQSAENRNLRKKIHQAWHTRASKDQFDNEKNINLIFKLRNKKAKLLNFVDYCDFILSGRMAKNYKKVEQLLLVIGEKAQLKAKKEIKLLQEFAKKELSISTLQAHDMAFVCQKLKEATFGFNDETLRDYFPINKVMSGLFEIIEHLYGVQFKEVNYSTWNEKVRSFEIQQNGKLIGILYADLYARKNKRSGAWMSEYQGFLEQKYHSQKQIPVAFITMNFLDSTESVDYVNFEDVLTLFHETGHSLQHLLTNVGLMPIAGINSVQWDAVELPSQLMENFCFNWHYLQKMTQHKKTAKPIGMELFNQIIASKNQFSGLFLIRQLIFALFDLNSHHNKNYLHWKEILVDLKETWMVSLSADYERQINSFSHIFAGGYASGYYSYLWADILASDIYGYFIENSKTERVTQSHKTHYSYFAKTANAKNGKHFLNHILSKGALKNADELFVNFRNRKPNAKYLFESYGLI